ncbi:restriction endonuclease subunit S [Paraburkholderia susongensis]|uniref:Type I restriction enzyme, S subunit n=1 Tax=Paraburkholderia susongensis TaxID=1515439 RepID=A0A1X7K788_9BURK|nr:restriction endonuclease subunit S [Paraburkholderia susongensis]SMG36961.1 type I restriction enzyme, S subunit [Paraburkholderia susongensis]
MSLPQYTRYKDSGVQWLGNLPTHWKVWPFKQLVDIQNGADHKSIEQSEGFPVIGSGGPFSFASDYLYDGEAVLLGRKGTIDKPLYVTGKFWTVDTMYWSKIRPGICGKFAYYTALTIPFDYYSTNTALPSMTKSALNAHLIAYPPSEEQAAIAAFLDHETDQIDVLIAEQEKLLSLLAEKRQATISHAVTRGLNPDVPMKSSEVEWLGDVPAHWEIRRLKSLSHLVTSGPRGWSERISETGSIFVQSGDLNDSLGIEFTSAKRVLAEDDAESARAKLLDGDIVVCITGAKTGNVAVCSSVPEDSYINQHLCLVRPLRNILPLFLGAALKSTVGQTQLLLFQYGLKQGLSLDNVKEVLVALPPLLEQEAILSFLSVETKKLRLLSEAAEQAIILLKERRSALISAAVTGKIDVREHHAVQAVAA